MHRVIAKYGLAAHLAFVVVAPLFLFAFCTREATSCSVLWLSLFAASWCFLAPSVRAGESTHMARSRVLAGVARDPLFWTSLALVAFTGARALNGGVRMAYDAEASAWVLAQPALAYFPGCVTGAGLLPFAASVALAVVLVGVRHSLGRSARMVFLLMASAGAGLASVVLLIAANQGNAVCRSMLAASPRLASHFGFCEGVYFLCGLATLATAFERSWMRAAPLFALAIGGTALGVFSFAPAAFSALFASLAVPVLLAAFAYLMRNVGRTSQFRYLAVVAIALAFGVVVALFATPPDALKGKLDVFLSLAFVPDGFLELRRTLSDIAFRAWRETPWIGTGLGSFGLDVRFQAQPADWAVLPRGVATVANGGWWLLAERGIVGAVSLALPFAFVAYTYGRRVAKWATSGRFVVPHPACWLAPLVFVALAASIPFDGSFLRPDAWLAAIVAASVAPRCFPSLKSPTHG